MSIPSPWRRGGARARCGDATVLGLAVGALGLALAGCGAATPGATPRAAIAAFDADLSAHRSAAACGLLGPISRGVLIQADTRATASTTCATALSNPGTQRTLRQFHIPAADVARAPISDQGGGVVLVQSDHPLPVTYTMSRSAGRWMIDGL